MTTASRRVCGSRSTPRWDKSDRGLDVFLEWLRRDGTDWSKHPTREDAMREYERIWTLLGSRQIEELVELPLITDPEVLDTLDVFSEAVTPSFFFDEHLSSLVVCRLVSLSLEYGNCDASCFGYVWLAVLRRAALWQLQRRISVRPAGI